jgi:hypothetical protein
MVTLQRIEVFFAEGDGTTGQGFDKRSVESRRIRGQFRRNFDLIRVETDLISLTPDSSAPIPRALVRCLFQDAEGLKRFNAEERQ